MGKNGFYQENDISAIRVHLCLILAPCIWWKFELRLPMFRNVKEAFYHTVLEESFGDTIEFQKEKHVGLEKMKPELFLEANILKLEAKVIKAETCKGVSPTHP